MIADNVAYLDDTGNPVYRIQAYRNREDRVKVRGATIDSDGNISHPPITKLSCFANPIEYYRGLDDKERGFKDYKKQPYWCAGCKSRIACGKFSYERVSGDIDLELRLDRWEQETKGSKLDRYSHRSFTDFAVACAERQWKSTNDVALAAKRKKDADRKRRERVQKKRRQKRGVGLTPDLAKKIALEHDERHATLLAASSQFGAPTWLRNLNCVSIDFTCTVWEISQLLHHEFGGKTSGSAIARAMIKAGRTHGKTEATLRVPVNEALNRITRLEDEPAAAPVWGQFTEQSTPFTGTHLKGVNSIVIEDIDD